MAARTVTVGSSSGLHARPASLVAAAAAEAAEPVLIARVGEEGVDASSILMLLTLNADHDDEVILRAEGDGADAALDALAALLERNLDEDF